jgi:isochorismate synthase
MRDVEALFARVHHDGVPGAARVFGGFAFGDRAPDGGPWDGFAAGTLVLPSVVVLGGPRGTRITTHGAECPEAAERALTAFRDRLARVSGEHRDIPFARARPLPARVDGFAAWGEAVRAVLEAVDRGEVQKVVLARSLDVRFDEPPDPVALLARVRADNPGGTIYGFEPRPGTVLLGAAPEVLVTLHAGRFLTTAVAGSTARGTTPEEDEALARRLLGSPKERAEHGFGVDDIVSRLSPFTEEVEIEAQPGILRLHRIQHLETDIAARVAAPTSALDLVQALHPTAAVAGAPREPAASLLTQVEALDRGWYAGPVGWCDARGDGEFAPALRCAVGQGREWRLFAGAGIVAGSDPDREWSETAMKLAPMLHALGAAGDG